MSKFKTQKEALAEAKEPSGAFGDLKPSKKAPHKPGMSKFFGLNRYQDPDGQVWVLLMNIVQDRWIAVKEQGEDYLIKDDDVLVMKRISPKQFIK